MSDRQPDNVGMVILGLIVLLGLVLVGWIIGAVFYGGLLWIDDVAKRLGVPYLLVLATPIIAAVLIGWLSTVLRKRQPHTPR